MSSDISDAEINAATERGTELCDELLEELTEENLDPIAMVFSIWVGLLHVLLNSGWTEKELIREVSTHARPSDHASAQQH